MAEVVCADDDCAWFSTSSPRPRRHCFVVRCLVTVEDNRRKQWQSIEFQSFFCLDKCLVCVCFTKLNIVILLKALHIFFKMLFVSCPFLKDLVRFDEPCISASEVKEKVFANLVSAPGHLLSRWCKHATFCDELRAVCDLRFYASYHKHKCSNLPFTLT